MTKIPRSLLIAGAVVAGGALALAACGSDTKKSVTPAVSQPGVTLEGTTWVLDAGPLGISAAESVVSTIRFDAGTASGTDGCNQFTGGYKVDGSQLTIGPLAGTQRACAGAEDLVGRAVSKALGEVKSYAISGDTLRLSGASGDALLTYKANTASIEGAWTATSVLYGDAIHSVIIGSELTATFSADGKISGSAGCNTMTGGYTVDGTTVKIGPLGATRKACVSPEGIAAQETGYLAALESATTFEQVGNQLTLLNAKGQQAVSFTKS